MPAATDTALQERRVSAPMIMRAAETRPSSYREEDNSVEVVWSTGARRTMFDWLEWDVAFVRATHDTTREALIAAREFLHRQL